MESLPEVDKDVLNLVEKIRQLCDLYTQFLFLHINGLVFDHHIYIDCSDHCFIGSLLQLFPNNTRNNTRYAKPGRYFNTIDAFTTTVNLHIFCYM